MNKQNSCGVVVHAPVLIDATVGDIHIVHNRSVVIRQSFSADRDGRRTNIIEAAPADRAVLRVFAEFYCRHTDIYKGTMRKADIIGVDDANCG